MTERGAVFAEEAYALGKMLDHSSWRAEEPKLPRLITPSDIDYPHIPLVFDNRGIMMLCELSRRDTEWHQLSTGQRWLYSSLVEHSPHFAVLCTHNVSPSDGKKINTRHDIQSFQVMVWDYGGHIFSRVLTGNGEWQRFVLNFYNDKPTKEGFPNATFMRRWIIGRSVGLIAQAK